VKADDFIERACIKQFGNIWRNIFCWNVFCYFCEWKHGV